MTSPALVPQPAEFRLTGGSFTLTPETPLRAPTPIAALVRELLSPATGFPFPEGNGGIRMTEIDQSALGPEGYRLRVTHAGVQAEGTLAGLRWAVQTLRQLLPPQVYRTTPGGGPRTHPRMP